MELTIYEQNFKNQPLYSNKFNLSKDEVQKVVDEQHATMQAERETQVKADVAKLVTDGKITQAQADAIR